MGTLEPGKPPSEPNGKPILTGCQRTNRDDAEWALTRARRYIFRGGEWTPKLHAFVNTWLDFLGSIPPGEKYPPEPNGGTDV